VGYLPLLRAPQELAEAARSQLEAQAKLERAMEQVIAANTAKEHARQKARVHCLHVLPRPRLLVCFAPALYMLSNPMGWPDSALQGNILVDIYSTLKIALTCLEKKLS
jgi:hypothetical protein